MLYIDIKYINLLSPYLRKFKKKSDYLFNFACPICGDSKKKQSKTRGFLYKRNNSMFFKCHNDGLGMSFGNLLKHVSPQLYEEYVLERYSEGVSGKQPHKEPEFNIPKPVFRKTSFETMTSISKLE